MENNMEIINNSFVLSFKRTIYFSIKRLFDIFCALTAFTKITNNYNNIKNSFYINR